MMKHTNTQWQKRFDESLAPKERNFSQLPDQGQSVVFLTSSSDIGVMRNGGRNGARFAPKAILNTFKKWTLTPKLNELNWAQVEVSSQDNEKQDFQEAQKTESHKISEVLSKSHSQQVFHLGGGHDHIYPLLVSLGQKFKKIIVLNIDAHADTRADLDPHSGTPFRQFAESFKGEFHLFQYGLHEFANGASTLSPLSHGTQYRLFYHETKNRVNVDGFLEKISLEITEECAFVFSLDADALESNLIEAVSAVNPHGVTREEFSNLWNFYQAMTKTRNLRPIVGIYEMNPMYDSISGKSIKSMASIIFEMLNKSGN